jgi:hypothetical protein
MATEQTLDTINNTNLKTIAETGAWSTAQKHCNDISHAKRTDQLMEMAMQNLVGHQQRLSMLAETYVGQEISNATAVDPVESVAVAKLFKGESDSALASVLAQLASGQMSAKIAQSTPPETGLTGMFAQLNALTQQNSANNASIANMNQSTQVAMLAIAQVLSKVAQSTPPHTGK